MGLISQVISGLFNGVSQQPATVRLATQCEEQVNADSSIVNGMGKRAPSEHVVVFGNGAVAPAGAFVQMINRDPTEQYVVVMTATDIRVFDLAGAEKTVSKPNGVSYLGCTTPKAELRMVTIADYSIIVNKAVTTAMDGVFTSTFLTGTVQVFSDLPESAGFGTIWEISGDPDNSFDNYFVEKRTGVFVETMAPNQVDNFNLGTMPHRLTRESNGTFTFAQIPWDGRSVGDIASSKEPSFIGRKFNDVFFHRNRLLSFFPIFRYQY